MKDDATRDDFTARLNEARALGKLEGLELARKICLDYVSGYIEDKAINGVLCDIARHINVAKTRG